MWSARAGQVAQSQQDDQPEAEIPLPCRQHTHVPGTQTSPRVQGRERERDEGPVLGERGFRGWAPGNRQRSSSEDPEDPVGSEDGYGPPPVTGSHPQTSAWGGGGRGAFP